jgi:hypothetical protein
MRHKRVDSSNPAAWPLNCLARRKNLRLSRVIEEAPLKYKKGELVLGGKQDPPQIGSPQFASAQWSHPEISPTQIGTAQVGPAQIGASEICLRQIGVT